MHATLSRTFITGTLGLLVVASTTNVNAAVVTLSANLGRTSIVPLGLSTGAGTVLVSYDSLAHSLYVETTFTGLQGVTTAAHIQSGTTPNNLIPPVATQTPSFLSFPVGVTSGTFSGTYDLTQSSSWNAAYINAHGGTIASAEAYFAQSLLNGTAFFNINTSVFETGEVRGYLVVVPAPLAASAGGLGLVGIALRRRRR